MSDDITITIHLDEVELNGRIDRGIKAAQFALDSQVLKDSNYYCPLDTSNLQKSGITSTVIGSGLITWRTPYARAQYYSCPNKSLQRNPNASQKWFEVAKSKNLKNWEKLANDEYFKNSK